MSYVNKPEVDQPLPFLPTRRKVMEQEFSELAFEAVMEGGSYERARQILTKQGWVNRFTGKPYTYHGVYLSSLRYLVVNHAEVRGRILERWREREDVYVTDEEWEEYIVDKAKVVLGNSSKKRFLDWLAENPWADKYDYIYAKTFGLRQKNFR
jgi:hypothetical protein